MASLPALATPEDLLARLGREEFSGDLEEARAETVLEDVSDAVRFESGKDWLDPDDPTQILAPNMIRVITLRVAERAMRNPEGFSSESAGDYSYQRNGATGEGGTYFTDREIKTLRRLGGKTGLWVQPVTRGEAWCRTEWVDDSFGCEPFPIGTLPGWW